MVNKLTPTGFSTPAPLPTSWNSAPAGLDVYVPDKFPRQEAEQALRHAALTRAAEPVSGSRSGEPVSNYPNRNGYDENFLGKPLPLPKIDPSLRDKVAPLLGQPDKFELKYTNFSIVMHKERRQALFTAVMIDGAKSADVPRDGEWTIDGRISRQHQLGNEAYKNNPIDKGHMVRRSDPAWGPDANRASDDTFVYTNAGLQHEALNQKEWLELENHVLDSAKALDQKMTVLTGPLFRDDDPKFDNKGAIQPPTQMPQKFWKMVVWNDPKEGLKGAAFVLSQEDFVSGGLTKAEFQVGRFGVYQVPIADLQKMTKLDFGPVHNVTPEPRKLTAENGYRPVV